jgi:hypothetical protein
MTRSEQARLLQRKASQDLAVLDLLASHGIPLPERFEALQTLTPFGTVFRYDDLPLEDTPDRRSWPPLLHGLQAYVTAAIEAESRLGGEASP